MQPSPTMEEPLQQILEAELARGNTIAEIGSWPPKCALLVILRRPFAMAYELPADVEFVEINDPHYWKSEYRYKGGVQTLACGFDW